MADNRRRDQRLELDLQAKLTYRFVNTQSSEAVETVAANISSGGAFLSTDTPLPLASRVEVEFLLELEDLRRLKFILSLGSLKTATSGKVRIVASGVVIRREERGVGVIFEHNYTTTPLTSSSLSRPATDG